jgi:hypothetical protein
VSARDPSFQKSFHPESASQLFRAACERLAKSGFPEEVSLPTTYFEFSSWFADILPRSPCLLIAGPHPEACYLLEHLECLVRNPVPLGHLNGQGFFSLSMDPRPTLLIDHDRMSLPTRELIRASNRRNTYVPSRGGLLNISCAKALYCGIEAIDDHGDESALYVNVLPSHGPLPVLDDAEKHALAAEFQPRFLAFRERHLDEVRASKFDLPGFTSGIRILSRILGAPLVDAPELQDGLKSLLRRYQEGAQARNWSDNRCVVIEALLCLCHQGQAKLYVGEIARVANATLRGRGESSEMKAREIGATLRRLGLSAKRDNRGFAIRVDDLTLRHIHDLARRFDVATVQEGAKLCSLCTEFFGAETGNEGEVTTRE